MSSNRENANIWWSLGFHPWGRWRGWRLFTRQFWRNPYLWHDSFGKFYHRLVSCRHGHRDPKLIGDNPSEYEWWCFACERTVLGRITP